MKQTTADKMLASLRRGADASPEALKRLGVDPAVSGGAVSEPVPAEPVKREVTPEKPTADKPAAEKPKPAKASRAKKTNAANVSRNVDFDVSTGKGIKHLTIRVPKEMAADLTLLAMRNKLSENGEPTTINELGIRAFERMLGEAA